MPCLCGFPALLLLTPLLQDVAELKAQLHQARARTEAIKSNAVRKESDIKSEADRLEKEAQKRQDDINVKLNEQRVRAVCAVCATGFLNPKPLLPTYRRSCRRRVKRW